MRYENALIRLLRRTLLWAPALIGWWTEEQHLSLVLLEDFVEHSQHRATAVRITLSHAVRVYEARLHFHAQLSGVRYLLYHWFLSSMLFFVSASVFCQFVAVAAAAYALRDSLGLEHGGDRDRNTAVEFREAHELFGERAAPPHPQLPQVQPQRQNHAVNPFLGGQSPAPAPASSRSQQMALATPPRVGGGGGTESINARHADLAVAAAAVVPSVLEPAVVDAAAAVFGAAASSSVSLAAISPLPLSSARSVAGDDSAASFAMPASSALPGMSVSASSSSAAALPIPSNARLSLSEVDVSESDESQDDGNIAQDSDMDSYSDEDANVDEDGMIGAPTGRVRGSARASAVEATMARTMPAAGSASVSDDSDNQLRQRARSSQ
jgi:hypothetical protein